jgi:hypothetical protein
MPAVGVFLLVADSTLLKTSETVVVNQIELSRTPCTWKLTVASHFALIAQMFTL